MKEIKAFIHRSRVADVVRALAVAGFRNVSVIDVMGMARSLDAKDENYSIEVGGRVVSEVKLELVCKNDTLTDEAVRIIGEHARTGQPEAGWIYISEIQVALSIK